MARAGKLEQLAASGANLPMLGLTFAVKDNLHVAGMPTTCNCPAFAIDATSSSLAIMKLEEAGAVLIGKNTMDQFATGLGGTRTPEPSCRNAIDPAYIPGGSSSGSAVAVARDLVAFSLGSDTGGSGRVPAACNGIVGLKPTLGLVSSRGLVLNSRFFDCIPIFAQNCADAYEVLERIKGFDPDDPFSRPDADVLDIAKTVLGPSLLAVPRADQLNFFGDDRSRSSFEANLKTLEFCGHALKEIDFGVFEEAGRLVFQSAMVAERLIEYGHVLETNPNAIHPAVRAAIEPGKTYSAVDAFQALYALKALQRRAQVALQGATALVVPTIPTIFTVEEMLAEPVTRNTILGTYTYFANPLDLCAVSVPGHARSDGLPSALCFLGQAGQDGLIRALATQFEAQSRSCEP
jgi:allophanate hydrolase